MALTIATVVLSSSLLLMMMLGSLSEAQMVPATFVFGDSVVDAGNNNYLPLALAKSNYPHYGVDFPTKKPTGRFSNGKLPSDLLAEKVGLPAPPPYLSIKNKKDKNGSISIPLTGLNFASAGAGVFNETGNQLGSHISMTEQVEDFSTVYSKLSEVMGSGGASKSVGKSLFLIVIGSNDMLSYYGSSDLRKKFTPEQRFNQMTSTLKSQLEMLYGYGARRFVVAGLLAIGCAPVQRLNTKNYECDQELNSFCNAHNQILRSMLQQFKSDHSDLSYTYFDTYTFFLDLLDNAANYGLTETKAGCCGAGKLEAQFFCLPLSAYCKDRSTHVFFDRLHPTEATYRLVVDAIVDGPKKYVEPMNVRQLVST
ncbi:unnamed protein product [Linum trigynum]|uniref:Uncharacterized protein n=2 Tax=Linum trigynum TaxID=586398 RepID=A0AAV2CCF9_9ROSI